MAFHDVEPDPASRCNGVVIPVKNEDLKAFDIRERQYIRVDVTEAVQPVVPGVVYTYVGKAEARELPRIRLLPKATRNSWLMESGAAAKDLCRILTHRRPGMICGGFQETIISRSKRRTRLLTTGENQPHFF
jgi:hypothetical protein